MQLRGKDNSCLAQFKHMKWLDKFEVQNQLGHGYWHENYRRATVLKRSLLNFQF
jgi:hypothetical protein